MTDDRVKKNNRIQLAKRFGLIVAGLFLLYVVVGFWVAAPILKPKLEAQLSGLLGRKVTIAEIKLNPLVLSATLSTLTVHEIDGQPFAGFETLYANSQLASIFKWALTVREIRVERPFGVLKLLPQNKLNIDDILSKLAAPKIEPKKGAEADLPRAVIEKFQISDGRAVIENLSGKEPIREEISPISFTIENLSTLKSRQGEYKITVMGFLGGRFELDGKMTVNPAQVQGNYTIDDIQLSHCWEHLKELVSFKIVSGAADVSGAYAVAFADGQLNAQLRNGAFNLDDFKLVEKGRDEVLIALPTFSITGISADLKTREIDVELIQTADGRVKSWLSPEGELELQRLFMQDLEKWKKWEEGKDPGSEAVPAQPWQAAVKKIEVNDWGLSFEDQTLTRPAKLTVDNIDMVVENLSNAKNKAAPLDLSMRFNQAGDVSINGTAVMVPLQADLSVAATKIALKPFQPYIDEAVNALIGSGTISSRARIRYFGADSRPQIRYDGDLSVDDVGIKDRVQPEDFITLARLNIRGVGLELNPNQLTVAQVLIDRPSARVTIDEAGAVNVVKVFAPADKETTDEKGTANLLKRLVAYFLVKFKGPIPMSIERVELKTFKGDFVDRSIAPPYQTHADITDATATGLSSDPSAKADFKFSGLLDGKAVFEGSGQMNPMNALKYGKVNVSLKDFALPSVTPYSGKFIGFKIDQGALQTVLNYEVADDSVKANNIIVIDRLALGDRVDSPDALKLPIKLAVALLKDSEGRIKLQVPVKGSVKDPQFDVFKTIQSALTGTIDHAGSTPFSAITEIDGFTGEQLRTVAFEFGLSNLQDREIQKLNALARFLSDKDALIIGIQGTADRRMDRSATVVEPPRTISLDEDSVPEQETDQEPETNQVTDDELKELAQQRAETVRGYLIEQAGVDSRRIHVKPIQINDQPDAVKGGVDFSLSAE